MLKPEEVSTRTVVAGIPFPSYIMNACGVKDTYLPELHALGASRSAGIVMKSCTIKPRKGNEEPRFCYFPGGVIQSMGLPNLGYEAYLGYVQGLKQYNKPIIASVAESDPKGRERIIAAFMESEADIVAINTSCPNDETLTGRMMCYDMHDFQVFLSKIEHHKKKPKKLKLPPYNDPWQQKFVADIAVQYGVKILTLINGVGRCLIIDTETEAPIIKATKGYGALAGEWIKYQAIGNVRSFYEHLQGKGVSIIGVGGIETGEDAFHFLLAGADAVQVGTCFEREGHGCFTRLDRELREIMALHGYPTIESAKGKMKQYHV